MGEEYARDDRLHQAIANNCVDGLHELIEEEPELLDRLSKHPFPHTPLHIAAADGKTKVAMELAVLKPYFARELNPQGYSPMHLALQNKHYGTTRALMTINPDLIRVRGRGGITPLHYVVEKDGEDELELLAEFLGTCGSSIKDLTNRCQTAVHVAVENHNLEALKVLLGWLERVDLKNILSWKDVDGKTAVHVAVENNNLEALKVLLGSLNRVDLKNILSWQDVDGKTALHVAENEEHEEREEREEGQIGTRSSLCTALLVAENEEHEDPEDREERKEHEKRKEIIKLLSKTEPTFMKKEDDKAFLSQLFRKGHTFIEMFEILSGSRDESARNVILIVATFVATATYQAALTPPGGYWPDDSSNSTVVTANSSSLAVEKPHQAGTIILTGYPLYAFTVLNSAVFLISILTIWVTTIPLMPHTLPVYTLILFLGVAYLTTASAGYPKSDTVGLVFIVVLFMIILIAGLLVPVFLWANYARLRDRVDARVRRVGNSPGRKD